MNTYVNFPGTCARRPYGQSRHLGATVTFSMTHEHSPEASRLPPEWRHAVLHARLQIGDMELHGCRHPERAADAECVPDLERERR